MAQQNNLNAVSMKPPLPFEVWSTNVGANWRLWLQQYEWYEIVAQLKSKPADVQVAAFMLSIGKEATVIFNKFDLSVSELTDVAEIKKRFQNHFCPHSKLYERYKLNQMVQLEAESFDEFLAKIQLQSRRCEFGDVHDSLLLDKIIAGIRNDVVREELLWSADDLTLGKAIQICRER